MRRGVRFRQARPQSWQTRFITGGRTNLEIVVHDGWQTLVRRIWLGGRNARGSRTVGANLVRVVLSRPRTWGKLAMMHPRRGEFIRWAPVRPGIALGLGMAKLSGEIRANDPSLRNSRLGRATHVEGFKSASSSNPVAL